MILLSLLSTILVNSVLCTVFVNRLSISKLSIRDQEVLPYLQTELSSCTSAQQNILSFLRTKGIQIGLGAAQQSRAIQNSGNDAHSRIVISTSENNIECRITLGKAPIGTKCVAPCGCTGSQKWVQFSELNRLRRKDPSQWMTCRTCQQRFQHELFTVYGGLKGNIIGFGLDNRPILRVAGCLLLLFALYISSFQAAVYRVLTSTWLWQKVISIICSLCSQLSILQINLTNHALLNCLSILSGLS